MRKMLFATVAAVVALSFAAATPAGAMSTKELKAGIKKNVEKGKALVRENVLVSRTGVRELKAKVNYAIDRGTENHLAKK